MSTLRQAMSFEFIEVRLKGSDKGTRHLLGTDYLKFQGDILKISDRCWLQEASRKAYYNCDGRDHLLSFFETTIEHNSYQTQLILA